jgi:hypothetical protein
MAQRRLVIPVAKGLHELLAKHRDQVDVCSRSSNVHRALGILGGLRRRAAGAPERQQPEPRNDAATWSPWPSCWHLSDGSRSETERGAGWTLGARRSTAGQLVAGDNRRLPAISDPGLTPPVWQGDYWNNIRQMIRPTLLIALSGTLLLGCGGGIGGSSAGAVTTSVSGGTRLNDLSPAQATQLCKDVSDANTATLEPTDCATGNHAEAVLGTYWYLLDNPTATDASLQAECSQLLTANEAGDCSGVAFCDATMIASSSPECAATVADIVNCLNENDAFNRKYLAATPACDALTTSIVTAYGGPGGPNKVVSMSASCSALFHCEGIITPSTPPPGT